MTVPVPVQCDTIFLFEKEMEYNIDSQAKSSLHPKSLCAPHSGEPCSALRFAESFPLAPDGLRAGSPLHPTLRVGCSKLRGEDLGLRRLVSLSACASALNAEQRGERSETSALTSLSAKRRPFGGAKPKRRTY